MFDQATRVMAKLKRSWQEASFHRVARNIFQTPPLRLRGDSPIFLSMVCHRDVVQYLLAIKSLYWRVGQGRISIINDGSLTPDDLSTLQHHIPGVEVIPIASIDTGRLPKGGTWERLVKIVELSQDNYVIQADADTLVCGEVPEVVRCCQTNTSFLLGTDAGKEILPAPHTARMVRGWIQTYGWKKMSLGVEAEASLDRLPDASGRSYVHSSSGFAGFARGSFQLADLRRFSEDMSRMLGADRWCQWGSEQIASNYLLANAPGTVVLPFPRHACFEPQLRQGDHAFLHFIGTYRYDRGIYQRRAAEFISQYGSLAPIHG